MGNAFGPFVLDDERTVLYRGAETIPLGRRGFALLQVLLAHDGGPVSKEQLLAEVWPGLIVEDVNLSVQVAHLRKALGRTPDGQDWVVTVPRYGYRLLAADAAGQRASPVPMLAVLPFHNLTGDGSQQYLVDGLVDELSSALSRFRGFGVFSRGARLASGADYVVEGSLRTVGPEIRVVITLANREGRTLWSDSFGGRLGELLSFQDHVVRQVASIIEPRIHATELSRAARKPPASLDAYELYLRGIAKLYAFDEPSNAEAISLLDRAIAIEPDNGTYLGFACWAVEMRISLGWPLLPEVDARRCIDLGNRAIERAGDDATVLAHCSVALQMIGLEYERGLAIAERAAALNPNDPVALLHAGLAHFLGGSLETALERLHYCIALQPNDAFEAMGIVACVYAALPRYDEALAWAKRSLAINSNYLPSHWIAVAAAFHLGREEEARTALRNMLARHPGTTVAGLQRVRPRDRRRDTPLYAALLGAGLPAA